MWNCGEICTACGDEIELYEHQDHPCGGEGIEDRLCNECFGEMVGF
jgi:hypothetical protein